MWTIFQVDLTFLPGTVHFIEFLTGTLTILLLVIQFQEWYTCEGDFDRWGGRRGLASVLDFQSLSFLLKKIGFALWPDIMLNQTIYYHSSEGGSTPFLRHQPLDPACPTPTPFLNFCFPPLFSIPPPFKIFQTVPHPHTIPTCLNRTYQPSFHIINRSKQISKEYFPVYYRFLSKVNFRFFKSLYKYIALSGKSKVIAKCKNYF